MSLLRRILPLALVLASSGAALAVDTAPMLQPPPLVLPAPVVRTLPNGLRVAVFTIPRMPIVQVQLRVPAGASFEDSNGSGVASLTAQMLLRGTTSRTARQFEADLGAIGGTLVANVSRDDAQLGAGFLAADLDAGLETLSDAVVNPRFDEDDLEDVRRTLVRQSLQLRTDARALTDDMVWAAAFPTHAYSRQPFGSPPGLARAKREELRAFHRDHWRPDRAVLAIAGAVDPDEAFRSAGEWFGRWSGNDAGAPSAPPIPSRPAVRLLDRGPSRRAEIRLLWPAPAASAPEAASWRLVARALDGGQTLPAGARASYTALRDAGLLSISISVPAESAASAVGQLRAAVRTFAATPASSPLWAGARRSLQREFAYPLESLGPLLSQWLTLDAAGHGADGLMGEWRRLGDATEPPAALAALAAEPVVLVGGGGEPLTRPLASLGAVTPLVLDAAGSTAASRSFAPASVAERKRGRNVLKSALAAHGGAARLNRMRDLTMEGRVFMIVPGSEIAGSMRQVRQTPYRLLFSSRFPQFEARQGLHGDDAWMSTHNDSDVVASDERTRAELRTLYESELAHLLRIAADTNTVVASRGSEKIADRQADFVDFPLPSGGAVRLAIDAQTHRVLAVDSDQSPDGIWHQRRVFSDFRTVGGLLLPFIEERYVDGTRVTTWRLTSIVVDSGVDEEQFLMPQSKMPAFTREKP